MKAVILVAWALASGVVHSDDDLKSLAEAVYFEAQGEPLACQIIVAQSILNRVRQARFPDSIGEVVRQRGWSKKHKKFVCQYSYRCDGNSDVMTNITSEIRSYQVASSVLMGEVPDLSEGADHYYAQNIVTPKWSVGLEDKFLCGGHTFGRLNW